MDGMQGIILCQPGNVRFEKEFWPYPHFMVQHFEAILAPLNEHPTEDLTYLSRHIPISIAVHDALSKEPVYLVYKNPKHLIKRFIEVLQGSKKQQLQMPRGSTHILQISNFSRRGAKTVEAMS